MSQITLQICSGLVTGLYSDTLCDGKEIVDVQRYSDVEFNPVKKRWQATRCRDGKVIAESNSRQECVRLEVEQGNKDLRTGSPV